MPSSPASFLAVVKCPIRVMVEAVVFNERLFLVGEYGWPTTVGPLFLVLEMSLHRINDNGVVVGGHHRL